MFIPGREPAATKLAGGAFKTTAETLAAQNPLRTMAASLLPDNPLRNPAALGHLESVPAEEAPVEETAATPSAEIPLEEPAPSPVVRGPGGLVLKQGTTPFPSLKKTDLTDAKLFPKTSRYIAAAHSVPMKLSMRAVEPEQGAVVVAHGTRIIRVEQEADDDVYMVPYLEQRVSAGPGAEPTQISETRLAPVPSRIAYPYPPDDILSAEVRGDSMTGVGLFDGDIVYFVRTDRVADGLYVLTVAGEIFVKRLEIDHFAERFGSYQRTSAINLRSLKKRAMT